VNLEILIFLVLAVAATIFAAFVSIAVVVRKTLGNKEAGKRKQLHRIYSSHFAALLLQELPPVRIEPRKSSLFEQYERLLKPTVMKLSRMRPSTRRLHRAAIRSVLIDFSRDLTGESFDRLTYVFQHLSLASDEIKRLKDRSWWIRAEAADTLGRLRAHDAVVPLTAALKDPSGDVRREAMRGLLVLIGVGALRTILPTIRHLSRWTAIELSVVVARFEGAAAPYLIEGLGLPDQSVVIFCIEMLAQIGFVEAVEPLTVLAETAKDPEIQAKALEALGTLGDSRSMELLRGFLHHKVSSVRLKAIEAMGRIGGESVLRDLQPVLSSPSFEEKVVVARALATIGDAGTTALRAVESGSDGTTAAIARQVLEEHEMMRERP
jgi:hypothetical protein